MTSIQRLRKAALDRLKAVGAELAAPLLLLFKNDVEVGPDTEFVDLEEADFDGYARPAALAFGASFQNVDDEWEIDAPSSLFIASGDTTPNTIYGWAIVTAAGDNLLIAERLEEPVAIVATFDGLTVQPRFIYGR
jgi:hypothetical protein